jgi:hypothetical protein
MPERLNPSLVPQLDGSGLTNQEKVAALKVMQGGHCAVCPADTRLVGDHDHDTGRLRGLLCRSCNGKEGAVRWKGSVDAGIEAYLESPPAAGLDWMWDLPDWWSPADWREVGRQRISVLEYVKANPRLARERDGAALRNALAVLENIELPPLP